MTNIAARLFDAFDAECELDELLEGVPHEKLGWDHYDCSLEIYGVPPDYRLTEDMQRKLHEEGFAIVFMNHTDKWETHYNFALGEFKAVEGWRVSYPHKRGESEKGIWVEKVPANWPKDCTTTGYVQVKP